MAMDHSIIGLAQVMGCTAAVLVVVYLLVWPPTRAPEKPKPEHHLPHPPWVGRQFRCPNCSCKWCLLGEDTP